MPLVAVILLSLGFWAFFWFVRMGGIGHLQAKSAQRKEAARHAQSGELKRTAVLRSVDDPRDAATVLMILVSRGGDPTDDQSSTIEQTLKAVFGFEHELTERLTQARFVARSAESFEQAGRVLADLVKKRLTADEKGQLIGMLEDVARLDGPSQAQADAIAAFRERIGVYARAGRRR
jgi:hypothetical protein